MKVGTIVQLKSGGEWMTIVKINDDATCACHWFKGDDLQMQLYHPDVLRVVPAEKIDNVFPYHK